jgi:hypothetical protein
MQYQKSTIDKKNLHLLSGLYLTIFISSHLFNHIYSIWGAEEHIELMNKLRKIYRNPLVESSLLLAVIIQVITGISIMKNLKNTTSISFEKLHLWSGLYIAIFLIIHVGAVITGRYLLQLDTNFYFGVAGLNTFPFNLFFIPYYSLAILSFFGHIAAIHYKKKKTNLASLTPYDQSKVILIIGLIITIIIIYGLTNHFQGVRIPNEYNILIGK